MLVYARSCYELETIEDRTKFIPLLPLYMMLDSSNRQSLLSLCLSFYRACIKNLYIINMTLTDFHTIDIFMSRHWREKFCTSTPLKWKQLVQGSVQCFIQTKPIVISISCCMLQLLNYF